MENDIINLVGATVLISFFHGLIPSHFLPIVALKKKYGWNRNKTNRIAFLAALSHSASTVVLGFALAWAGSSFHHHFDEVFHLAMPVMLIGLGGFFIFQHYRHRHFHLQGHDKLYRLDPKNVIGYLLLMMFFSPCLEVEGIFLAAGKTGAAPVLLLGGIYTVISVASIVLWVMLAQMGMRKLNWHRIEHYSGLISGTILLLVGITAFWWH